MDRDVYDLCSSGHLDELKKLYVGNINFQKNTDAQNYAFYVSCCNGKKEIAEWLYSLGHINFHTTDDEVFRWSCYYGRIEIAKWLYSLGGVDINANYGDAFKWSCYRGDKEMAEWLYSLCADIHVDDDKAFMYSCNADRAEIVKWLLLIGKFNDDIVDKYTPNELHEYAFNLGYLPISKMKASYNEYKRKIMDEIKEKNINGIISVFEMDDLINIIGDYI